MTQLRIVHRLVPLRLHLFTALLLLGCATGPRWTPSISAVPARSELPFDLAGGGMPGFVLRRGASRDQLSLAVLDTGSPMTIVTPRFAADHGLKTRATSIKLKDFQGKITHLRRARVPSLKLREVEFRDFDVIVADLPAMKAISDRLDVVLSSSQFRDVLLTIDYPRRRLILEGGALPEPNGRDVLPLRRHPDGHLLVPATVLSEEAWLVLDTGNTGEGVLLSRYRLVAVPWASRTVDAYAVQTFLGTARARVGRMNGDVTIGQHTIRRPMIGISLDDDVELLGADVLRHFAVTIDQKNDRVRFARASTEPIETPPLRRLGFVFTDATGTAEPLPGSEAERAGLRRGDRILSINGVPPEHWSNAFIQQLEEAGQPLWVRIARGDQEHTRMVPLTVLVP